MSKDRFQELMNFQMNKNNAINNEDIKLKINDDYDGNDLENTQIFGMFQKLSDRLKLILEKINVNSSKIQELKSSYLKATTQMIEKDISSQLNLIINQNQKLFQEVDSTIKEMNNIVNQDQLDYPNEPETRMKKQMLQGQTQNAYKVIEQCQEIQDQFKESLKQKIKRQVKHLDSNLTEKQIEEMCENPDQVQMLLQEKMYGKASIQLQNAVSDIQDKYKDIQKLEKSVEQVFQLFQDLAVLVYQQGQQIDKIEGFISQAQDYVIKADKELVVAKEEQKSAQKKMCCILIIVIVILVIILAPTLATVMKK